MALREFSEVPYVPILLIRPGEMRALDELPDTTKDLLLPLIPLRPWVGAHHLSSALEKIAEAYGDRPTIVGVGEPEPYQDRPVFNELAALRDPNGGFANWRDFIAADEHRNFIPLVQFSPDPANEVAQLVAFHELGRGLVLHVPDFLFENLAGLIERVATNTGGGQGVLFILDWRTVRGDHLFRAAIALQLIQNIRDQCPHATIALSASSFPTEFDGVTAQDIFERRLFNEVIGAGAERVIYSDRGSARAEQMGGGGGLPYPRIDYPLMGQWLFFRNNLQNGAVGYQAQARALAVSPHWNPDLRVWGTQMIERTISLDPSAITSPQRATAARINLHLHLQTFYGQPEMALETEDDWDD